MPIKINKSTFDDKLTIGEYINILNETDSLSLDWNKYLSNYVDKYYNLGMEYFHIIKSTQSGALINVIKLDFENKIILNETKEFSYFTKTIINNGKEITKEDFINAKNKVNEIKNNIISLKKNIDTKNITFIEIPKFIIRSEGTIIEDDIENIKHYTLREYKNFVRRSNNKSKKEANKLFKSLKEQILNKTILCLCDDFNITMFGNVIDVIVDKYDNEDDEYAILIKLEFIQPINEGIFTEITNYIKLRKIYYTLDNNVNDLFK